MNKVIDNEGRTCSKCNKYKTWDNFAIVTQSKTGKSAQCRECQKEYSVRTADSRRRYREKNAERIKNRKKEYYSKNKESIQKKQKKYRQEHIE
jgi:hypothetical protein